MQFQMTDLQGADLLAVLGNNDFGVDIGCDSRGEMMGAIVWTESNFDGTGQIGGFTCGQIVRQTGSFPRYTLLIEDGRVNRERIHGLATDLLNDSWRA